LVETVLRPEEVRQADRLYLGNSVRGLVPARLIGPG
jgi:branched-subunit amino acid aminotransferase/4-amino-4-deoxychorismate lyase